MSDINIGLLTENENLSEFEITENFSCVRFLDQNKERFELEFNLEKGNVSDLSCKTAVHHRKVANHY